MDGLDALGRANTQFEARLRLVQPRDWERPTPCDAWDVRALINHVVGGNRRYTMLLHGASAADVNATRALDHLGDDAGAAFRSTAVEVMNAFAEPGAPKRLAHHPLGDRTGAELLEMRVLDISVHAWDLAVALGADDTIDPALVDFVITHSATVAAGRQHGTFATSIGELCANSSPQARLLHLVGRRPAQGDTR